MKRRRPKKPSQTRRHRESVAAKRRARAFYRLRNGYGGDALEQAEAEGLRSWRGCGVVVAVLTGFVLLGWALKLFL